MLYENTKKKLSSQFSFYKIYKCIDGFLLFVYYPTFLLTKIPLLKEYDRSWRAVQTGDTRRLTHEGPTRRLCGSTETDPTRGTDGGQGGNVTDPVHLFNSVLS